MIVVRIIVNAIIMALEIAAVAGVAWLGFTYPLIFAGVTAGLAFVLGLMLEHARLRHELPFYFGRAGEGSAARAGAGLLVPFVALSSSLVRAVVAGVVALLTFSGTDQARLFWVAIVFGVTLYLAAAILRFLAVRLDARPSRWGYFRFAAPLGIIYSVGLALAGSFGVVRTPGTVDIGRTIIVDTPERPNLAQASELLFQLKLYIDSIVVTLLRAVIGPDWAPVAGVLLSVNVLTGFVVAMFAVVIAEAVVGTEDRVL
ncbi:MAG: hypothetical protein ACK4MF_06510 [Hyphomicrobiaceae bacterium]